MSLARLLPKLKMFCWLCVARRAMKKKTPIDQYPGQEVEEDVDQETIIAWRLGLEIDMVLVQQGDTASDRHWATA